MPVRTKGITEPEPRCVARLTSWSRAFVKSTSKPASTISATDSSGFRTSATLNLMPAYGAVLPLVLPKSTLPPSSCITWPVAERKMRPEQQEVTGISSHMPRGSTVAPAPESTPIRTTLVASAKESNGSPLSSRHWALMSRSPRGPSVRFPTGNRHALGVGGLSASYPSSMSNLLDPHANGPISSAPSSQSGQRGSKSLSSSAPDHKSCISRCWSYMLGPPSM